MVVTATFYGQDAADRAIQDLLDLGILPGDIAVVMAQDGDSDSKIVRGFAAGGAIGGALGALLGAFLLGGAVVLTGGAAAPLVAAGPLFGALAGAVSGVALGSVAGALIEAGLSPGEASAVQRDAESGGLVIVVRVPAGQEERVRAILLRDGGGVAPGTPRPAPALETVRGETGARSPAKARTTT